MPVSTEPASTTSASPTTVIMQSNPIQPALLPDPQQGEQAIVAWLAKLSDFCHNRLPEHQHEERPETSFYTFSSKEADAIKLLLASLNCDGDSKADKRVIKWYPNYGCFLIRERRDGVVVLLTLVSLDGWTLESSTGGSAARSLSEAAAGTFSLMSCGLVPAGIVTNLLSQVDTLLSNAHSSQSELGKHLSKIPRFSPSVVHLAIKIAIVKEGKISDNEPTYQGGTTDIGKTPDHRPSRETAFPLVYVACINIVKNVILAQRVFFHIHIHDIDQEIGAIEGRPETGALRSSVDRIFHALERVAETLFDYQQLGLDIKPGVDRVSAMRGRLDAVMDSFGKTLEARYKFDVQSLVSITKQPELRNFQTITRAVADDDADPRAADHAAIAQAVRKRALEEIEVITPFYMPGADLRRMFRNVLSWIQRVKGSGTSISYIMAHIEHFMMAQARLLKEPVVPDEWIEEEGEALRSLMEEYQALYAQRSALADFAHLLLPRQRSLRVLVTWIAFAMFHKAGLQICPLLSGYGVAIDYHDLRVLVLDQDHALEALALVTEYLRSHDIPERRVFSTRHRDDQANNNAFAVEFSRTSNEIQAFWKHECDQASQRAAQHYEEVRKKVNEANRIREKITSTSSRLAEAEEIPYGMRTHSDDNRISSLSGNLSRLRSDLNETLKTPRSVINPFPSREDLALPIIFNYLMPRYLVRLAEAGFIAQNTLRPENSQISGDNRNLVEMECKLSDHTSWTYHTNSRSNRAAHLPGLPRVVYAATSTIQPPKKVGPASVDSIHSPGQCSWFPEQETVLMWRNGNPFGLSRHSITMGFIDGIGRDMSCFSWMISYPADPNAQKECARGNYAVAELHKRPVSLEKRSFLAMGGLRSYPHQQFRKLFLALSDRVMPLDNEAAQRLIRQTIYQVGELSNHIAPRNVLADYVEEIAEKPRDHQKILILGEISAYLSNFDDAFCDLCRQFGSIAGDWANQAKDMFESETSTSLAVLNEHQGRESLMLCYAILCSVLGRIASVDIKNYCRWVVRLYYCSIFVENAKVENAAAIRKLKTQCREAISRRLLAISDLVNARRNEALTYAVQAVPDSVACFEAAHQRDHYAVNIFTGRVVLNGNPPGRLPKAVLNDDLYRRSFGNRDFEVGVDATGQVYRSVRTVHGRFYAFELMHTGVAIYEIKPDRCCEGPAVEANGSAEWIARRAAINAPPADQVLQLIDPSASRSWTTTLPVRMLSGHSFWRHRESDSVLARGVPFEDRNVSFLAKPEGCFVVPRHDKAKPLAELLELHTAFDRLISPPANVLHTLAKFEDPKFIHGHISPDHQTIRIIMPRPGVSFTLRDDVLVSDAYKGYKLAEQQQFGDLIPSFQQYLVLERMAKYGVGPRYKWIVPLGAVCIEGDVVRIQVVDKSLGTINCTDFDEHHRFGLLQASTINSRIQLAAIFAAAGTALPEPRIHMTGAEYAARLLRGCITNNPLTRSEVAMIQSIVDVARPWPFLVLLCDHLLVVSSRVSMLYQKYASKSSIDHDDRPAGYYEIIGRTFAQVQEAQTAYEHQVRSARVYNTMRRALTLTEFGFDLLDEPRHLTPAATEILSELETSWTRYMSRRDVVARAEADELLREFIASTLLPQVTKRREDVEALVWSHTTHRVCHGSVVLELCKAVNWIPAATLADLVRASFDRVTLERLAPTLTPESVDLLQSWIVFGMKLSVLEDKLNRLLVCDRSHLGQELIYIQHPIKDCNRMWLAFEVEQGIQIRREQYQMAKHLIENPGSISQLNMGLGKTRVIVPMMILYWSAHARETLRVYVLRALLSEVRKYLHRTLSASSVFCIGIVHLPFHRRVQTTHDTIQCMKSIWK
ncbi:uncharacterized protein BJ171DRAFT_482966, partial [Polychytrium aggregatum]|uniref:uncharacterized protein n=1 Tax=Polychytrium aggregatum TaxID=110093 RepID=UPI0022FE522A